MTQLAPIQLQRHRPFHDRYPVGRVLQRRLQGVGNVHGRRPFTNQPDIVGLSLGQHFQPRLQFRPMNQVGQRRPEAFQLVVVVGGQFAGR